MAGLPQSEFSDYNKLFEINYDDLISRKKDGIHHSTKPIVGYKKIECMCDENPWWAIFAKKKVECTSGVATLEIPENSTIVRPLYIRNHGEGPISSPSNKLRTDNIIMQKYEPLSKVACKPWIEEQISMMWNRIYTISSNCYCYSIFQENYQYRENQNHKPKNELDLDLLQECAPGLHFFIEKEHAMNYREI